MKMIGKIEHKGSFAEAYADGVSSGGDEKFSNALFGIFVLAESIYTYAKARGITQIEEIMTLKKGKVDVVKKVVEKKGINSKEYNTLLISALEQIIKNK